MTWFQILALIAGAILAIGLIAAAGDGDDGDLPL